VNDKMMLNKGGGGINTELFWVRYQRTRFNISEVETSYSLVGIVCLLYELQLSLY
jgi:hypothetical protein